MSTSGGTAGFPEGGFVRLRDSSNGFSAELNRQKKLEEERQRQKQAENERREALRAEEKEKRRVLNEQHAADAFREYHDLKDNTPSQNRGRVVAKYIEARGGRVDADNYKKGLNDLNDPEFIRVYCPEKYAKLERAKADAAVLDHVIYCDKCGLVTNRGYPCGCFQVGKQYGTLTVTEINGDSCTAKCQCGREGVATRRDIEDGTTVCMVGEEKER